MYYNKRQQCENEDASSVSYAIELTRTSAEIEDYELRHNAFLQSAIASGRADSAPVVSVIQSISRQHHRVGKRDFSECSHYRKFQPTNDNKCINVRDDQICKYPNGDTYDGQFLDTTSLSPSSCQSENVSTSEGAQLKHGKGICTYVNGDVYDGDWSLDKW